MTSKMKNTYQKISEAREILGLPEKATVKEIKLTYQSLMKKWHPDKNIDTPDKCHKMTQKINRAYEVLMKYCDIYQISFLEEDVMKYRSAEEQWMEKFGDDPMWGSGKSDI